MLEISAGIIQQNGQLDPIQVLQQANYALELLKHIYAATVGYNLIYQLIAVVLTAALCGLVVWIVANNLIKHYLKQQQDLYAKETQTIMIRLDAIEQKLPDKTRRGR